MWVAGTSADERSFAFLITALALVPAGILLGGLLAYGALIFFSSGSSLIMHCSHLQTLKVDWDVTSIPLSVLYMLSPFGWRLNGDNGKCHIER